MLAHGDCLRAGAGVGHGSRASSAEKKRFLIWVKTHFPDGAVAAAASFERRGCNVAHAKIR